MPEKKYFSPSEAIAYLNEKFKPETPINLARLARLRREKRIKGERVGESRTSVYTHRALEMVSLADIQDKRRVSMKGNHHVTP